MDITSSSLADAGEAAAADVLARDLDAAAAVVAAASCRVGVVPRSSYPSVLPFEAGS